MRFSEQHLYLLAQALSTSASIIDGSTSSKVRPYDPALGREVLTLGSLNMRSERHIAPRIGGDPTTLVIPPELTARVYDGEGLLLGRTKIPVLDRKEQVAASFAMAPEREAYDVIHALMREPFAERGSRIVSLLKEAEAVRNDLRRRLSV